MKLQNSWLLFWFYKQSLFYRPGRLPAPSVVCSKAKRPGDPEVQVVPKLFMTSQAVSALSLLGPRVLIRICCGRLCAKSQVILSVMVNPVRLGCQCMHSVGRKDLLKKKNQTTPLIQSFFAPRNDNVVRSGFGYVPPKGAAFVVCLLALAGY